MRAFSTLEILLALAIGVTAIVGASLIAFGTPEMLENARLEYAAYGIASAHLTKAERKVRHDFGSISSIPPSVSKGYDSSLEVTYVHDDLAARLTARVSWTDTRGKKREVSIESLVTHPEAALLDACSPFVFEKEVRETSPSHLTSEDLLPGISGQYPVSDVVATRDSLLISVSTTLLPTDPTLLLFELGNTHEPSLVRGTFDNASTTRVGYAAVSVAGKYAYAANSFGSASPTTCSTHACAQLQVFDMSKGLELIGSLTLPMNAPPYAQSSGNRTTLAKAIAYRKGYVYLGLEKTLNGQEFNIIDVQDPEKPRWVGGAAIGRSVNDISIRGTRAYLATSDPAREFVVVDIENPSDPWVISEWNAPGSTNFGLGNAVLARAGKVYTGRTYVGNAPELYVFNENDFEAPVFEYDPGTILIPRSVNGIIVRNSLLAVVVGKRFELWNWNGSTFVSHAPSIELPGTGTSLACRGDTFYVGGVTDSGEGFISTI